MRTTGVFAPQTAVLHEEIERELDKRLVLLLAHAVWSSERVEERGEQQQLRVSVVRGLVAWNVVIGTYVG